jgi:hypothetical protein
VPDYERNSRRALRFVFAAFMAAILIVGAFGFSARMIALTASRLRMRYNSSLN